MMKSIVLVAAALLALPAAAQQVKSVDGLVINLGLMSAEKAVHAEGHREAHPEKFPSGSQHVLITVSDAASGKRIGDAAVEVEVVDPKGNHVKRPLLRTGAGGLPDYSELFVFGWSGRYALNVSIAARPGAKPVKASFAVNHSL
jgi:ABC-type glycerol-3-phosphate transport system substrate-binding protein